MPLLFFLENGFGIKQPTKVDMPLNKETKPKNMKHRAFTQLTGCDTGSIFKQNTSVLNEAFSFSYTGFLSDAKKIQYAERFT